MQIKKNEKSHDLILIQPQTQNNPEDMYLRFLTSVEKIVNIFMSSGHFIN